MKWSQGSEIGANKVPGVLVPVAYLAGTLEANVL